MINQSKPTTSLVNSSRISSSMTNSGFQGRVAWDDAAYAWDSSAVSWDSGVTMMTNQSKPV